MTRASEGLGDRGDEKTGAGGSGLGWSFDTEGEGRKARAICYWSSLRALTTSAASCLEPSGV